jgi:hypothetical protein
MIQRRPDRLGVELRCLVETERTVAVGGDRLTGEVRTDDLRVRVVALAPTLFSLGIHTTVGKLNGNASAWKMR